MEIRRSRTYLLNPKSRYKYNNKSVQRKNDVLLHQNATPFVKQTHFHTISKHGETYYVKSSLLRTTLIDHDFVSSVSAVYRRYVSRHFETSCCADLKLLNSLTLHSKQIAALIGIINDHFRLSHKLY